MLPSTPTDNLFKFIAIGGLVLAGFSAWAIKDLEDQLKAGEATARDQYIEFVMEMETKMNELASKVSPNKKLDLKLGVPDQDGKMVRLQPGAQYPLAVEGQHRDQYRGVLQFWDNWLASALPRAGKQPSVADDVFTEPVVRDLRAKLRQHSSTVESLWLQTDRTERNRELAFWGIIVGSVASFMGFFFWIRTQRRQDAAERVKAEKEKHELEQLKKAQSEVPMLPSPPVSPPVPPAASPPV